MSSNKKVPIRYTSRDFDSIKQDLVDYAKRYYPDTFRDFSEASFGSLMLDTVAYVGDILSFYLDYEVNEAFVDSATEYNNVINHGEQMGYKFKGGASAFGVCAFYIKVPANSTGMGPDSNYIPILKSGATLTSTAGSSFILLEDINFEDPANEVVAMEQNVDTGLTTFYGIQAFGPVVSGKFGTETFSVGQFERFKKLTLSAKDVVEILSVSDSEGHIYYEVPYLSQNVVYRSIVNRSGSATSADAPPAIVKPFVVPRRFTVKRTRRTTMLQFGYGSDAETNSPSVADPSSIVLQRNGRDYVTDESFDPSKLLDTDKFGIAPSNTTLTVRFRKNDSINANAAVGAINRVINSNLEFKDPTLLNASLRNTVLGSLDVTNLNPISGDASNPSIEELKRQIMDNFSSQNRAVTEQDYKALTYAMPSQFGSVKRCAIYRDPDSFRRNLNLYVMSQDKNSNLVTTSAQVKTNLKTWLSQYKMINDTIDILDAKVVNIQIKYTLVSNSPDRQLGLVVAANRALAERYNARKFDIGESFDIAEVYQILNKIPGVADVRNVRIINKFGGDYSNISYNIRQNTSADGRFVSVPKNVILELKFSERDIIGTVK